MSFTIIGIVVGIIMGLTGAGGAMISIPLFMALLDTSLKEATVLSLIAVLFGTGVNLFGQLGKINWKIALSMTLAGAITNYLSLPFKSKAPEILIALLLTAVGIYGLKSVWSKTKNTGTPSEMGSVSAKALLAGSFLGILTTLTGLGGGVVLIPILIVFFGKTYEDALPTSLATILLIALTAFLFQMETALSLINYQQLVLIGTGAILSYFILKYILKRLSDKTTLQIRRIVFTVVTVYSVATVVTKVL